MLGSREPSEKSTPARQGQASEWVALAPVMLLVQDDRLELRSIKHVKQRASDIDCWANGARNERHGASRKDQAYIVVVQPESTGGALQLALIGQRRAGSGDQSGRPSDDKGRQTEFHPKHRVAAEGPCRSSTSDDDACCDETQAERDSRCHPPDALRWRCCSASCMSCCLSSGSTAERRSAKWRIAKAP